MEKRLVWLIVLGVLFIPLISSAEGDYTGITYDTSSVGASGLFSAITTNNTFIWGTDATPLHNVYKMWENGTYTGQYFTTAGSMTGITTNKTFFWIFSSGTVTKYWMNGTNTTDMFTPSAGYSCAREITQNGTFFWLNCGSNGNAIRIYWLNGSYYGTFAVNTEIAQGRGIYTNNQYIWITDDTTDEVYRYYMNGTYTGYHWDTFVSGNTGAKSITMDDTYFYVSDTVNKTIFLYYGYPDTVSPFFITIPNNSSLMYLSNLSVNFNADDDIAFGYYAVNDSRFKIFQNGTLVNNNILPAGTHILNITINDTSNNINWTLYSVQVNKSMENCQVLFNETSPLEYTNTFRVWANCTTPFVLTRNGTVIANNSEQDLGVSAYNFSFQRNDTQNYTYIFNQSQFIIGDTTPPVLSILSPTNGESFTVSTIDLNFSVSDGGIGLDTCWYQNDTGSNVTVSCSSNTTISQASDGTYTIYMWANDSYGNVATDNKVWTISANAPSINLIKPNEGNFSSSSSVNFTFTATDSNGVDTCELWTNTTGSWLKNQTLTSITSGLQTSFSIVTVGDNFYMWNVWCNDTTGLPGTDGWATINKTFTIDTVKPSPSIDDITTTDGSQTITFNTSVSDFTPVVCTFSIFNSTGGVDLYSNQSISCNYSGSATVSAYGNYTFILFSNDSAGNVNSTSKNFTTQASVIIIPGTGGGGGETTIEVAKNFSILTVNYQSRLDLSLSKDSIRSVKGQFILVNKGLKPVNVKIVCSTEGTNKSANGVNACDYVTINQTTFTIPPNEEEITIGTFYLLTPENSSLGDRYYFNLFAISEEESEYSKLSVSSRVSFFAFIYKWSFVPAWLQKENADRKAYPVWSLALPLSFLFFVFFFVFLSKRDMPVLGFFLGIFIFISALYGILWFL